MNYDGQLLCPEGFVKGSTVFVMGVEDGMLQWQCCMNDFFFRCFVYFEWLILYSWF